MTPPPGPDLRPEETERYARHLLLPEVGLEGQRRLKGARVLCVGAGGLGSPALLYLAAAGVGRLGVVDPDHVDLSNLQRQVLHGTSQVGRPKTESARARLHDLNPHCVVDVHPVALRAANALDLIAPYDLVIDGSDNFPTRYLLNDACVLLGKPLVYGSIHRFEGQASVFNLAGGPTYRDLYPEPPPPGLVPSCAEGGVLGVLPGIIGGIQATEALKILLGVGSSLSGRLLLYDALAMRFRELRLERDPAAAPITALIDYDQFCGLRPASSAPEGFTRCSPATVRARLRAGWAPAWVDLREPAEWATGTLPEATHFLPLGQLLSAGIDLPLDHPVLLQCQSGQRSAQAAAALVARGHRAVFHLEGGLRAWRATAPDPQQG